MRKLFAWFFRRHSSGIKNALDPRKKVKIHGILFELRKINPIDYLAGFKAVNMVYDTYKTKPDLLPSDSSINKLKEHYTDVFMAAVVSPELSRNGEGEALSVAALINAWDVSEALYKAIMEHTYGKKKLRSLISQRTA